MENSKEYLKELKRKLSANKFIEELNQIKNMATNKQVRNDFNNEMVNKTWQYQKKYGFETNQRQGHEFWNNEADAFKHAFGSAEMFFNMGKWGSLAGGIYHENETPNNPQGEWNMDSWNNHQGREIAKEILKQYGNQVYKMSDKQRSDLIAEKIMKKMRSGELITKPDDQRKYDGKLENIINDIKKHWDGNLTGQALPVAPFTREQIGAMTSDEFAQNEKAIREQWGSMGIPSERDLPKESKKSVSRSNDINGKWVTINGNHVLIKD